MAKKNDASCRGTGARVPHAAAMAGKFRGRGVGAVLMVAVVAVLFRLLLNERLLREAKAQADRGLVGRMEGHAEMDTVWRWPDERRAPRR